MKAKKIGKIILRVLLIIFILFVVFVIGVFVFHQVKRNEEINLLKEKGYYNPVPVGDHNINVAKFGNPNGKHTIVAMAGLGSADYPVSVRKVTAEVEKDSRHCTALCSSATFYQWSVCELLVKQISR